jgi:hypothetical protein
MPAGGRGLGKRGPRSHLGDGGARSRYEAAPKRHPLSYPRCGGSCQRFEGHKHKVTSTETTRNLAGIIDCGIFMNPLFAVRRLGAYELFASVVVGRDALSFCRLQLSSRPSLRVWLCYELPGDSTMRKVSHGAFEAQCRVPENFASGSRPTPRPRCRSLAKIKGQAAPLGIFRDSALWRIS